MGKFNLLLTFAIVLMVKGQYHQRLLQTNCKGDIFTINHLADTCSNNSTVIPWSSGKACQCLPPKTTFRPDNGLCVDKLDDCLQVAFDGVGSTTEMIPLVTSVLYGQNVHFGAQLALKKVIHFDKFVCQVSEERFLSIDGWTPLANLTSTEQFNFQLNEMSDRQIGLQFLGSDNERWKLEMKLIRVDLTCVTAEKSNIVPKPCIAFRTATTYQSTSIQLPSVMDTHQHFLGGSGTSKWIIVSLGAGLLGVTYVLAILVYVVIRKNTNGTEKSEDSSNPSTFTWIFKLLCGKLNKTKSHHSNDTQNETLGRTYCDNCMANSCNAENYADEMQMHFQPKLLVYKSQECHHQEDHKHRPNVTVVSVGGQSDHSHRPIQRSKSDVGHVAVKYNERHNGCYRKQSTTKRSESMTANNKSVSFDPNDTIISPKRVDNLVTFASLSQSEKSIGNLQPSTSILKKSEEQQLPPKGANPPRFLISSFNKKQRANKILKKSYDDSDYHSSDSDRFNMGKAENRVVNFAETI